MHRPVLNKTPRLSSARMFVRLYRLLFIHCIYVSKVSKGAKIRNRYDQVPHLTQDTNQYVSATKPTCSLNTGSIRSLNVTGKAIMLCSTALPSMLCAALHCQSNVGSMSDCNPCRSLDLSVWVEILSGVQVP